MERIKNPDTLALLEKLMYLYDEQDRKKVITENTGQGWDNQPMFLDLMKATGEWLSVPEGESNGKNRKKRSAHVDSEPDEREVDVQPSTRRRLNRKRRKNNK